MGREVELKYKYWRLRHAISASSMPDAPHDCSHFRSEWLLKGVDVSKVWSSKSKVRVLRRARGGKLSANRKRRLRPPQRSVAFLPARLPLHCLILLVQMQ
jgi:hypothetical protein